MRFLLPLLLLSSGCVLKGKHNEIVDGYQMRIAAMETQMADQEASSSASLAAMRMTAAEQEAALQSDVDRLNVELESTRDSLARAVSGTAARDAELARMREAVADLERRKAKADAALAEYRDLVGRFQTLIDAGTLRVRVVDGRMVVELATDILFAPARATISDEGQTALIEVAGVLSAIPNRQYQIAGHTDNVPISNERFPSNWELGAARALAVTKLMVANGLAETRVSGSSYAATKPAAPNDTPEGRELNRRIEIVVVPDLSELPGYAELQQMQRAADQ